MTRLELPVQNNAGGAVQGLPYIETWISIRNKFNLMEFKCNFKEFNVISIALRIGGDFGDFGGSSGIEKRRIDRRSGYLGCDNVVQIKIISEHSSLYGREKPIVDFLSAIDFILSHDAAVSNILCRDFIINSIKNEVKSVQ